MSIKEKLRSKKLRLAAVFVVVIAITVVVFLQKEDVTKVTYHESKVEVGTIEIKVTATGTVQPENRLEIKPPIPGRVESVLIEEGQKVKRGQILAWMSSTERAALLDAARSKGEAEVRKWEEIYPQTPILAPLGGTIVLKNIEQGQVFTSADVLMVMSNRLTVKAQVDETDIASVALKQEAEIILDAYGNEKIPAQVDKIAFEAVTVNSVTTYIVDVLPKKVPDFMRSGMTANVTFFVNSKENILLVPSDALRTSNGRSTILVREGEGQIEKEVVVGVSNGKQTEILSGLAEGEIVLSVELKIPEKKTGSNPFNPARGGKVKK